VSQLQQASEACMTDRQQAHDDEIQKLEGQLQDLQEQLQTGCSTSTLVALLLMLALHMLAQSSVTVPVLCAWDAGDNCKE